MLYISTRGGCEPLSGAEAILRGIAADGGLFVPQSFPAYMPAELCGCDYRRLAREIFALYLPEFSAGQLTRIVDGAYREDNFPAGFAPCHSIDETLEIVELSHGPTSAFKDMALQALPWLMSAAREQTGDRRDIIILTATSGDTGKAALEGFKDVPGVKIIVFYPAGGVSRIQELQMTTTGGENTYVFGVQGNFDDCQTGVKEIFAGERFANFSSANSINWGRLLPQIVYYYYAYGQMLAKGRVAPGEQIDICVPTGNFGNILAAWYAAKMGLPVARFICASNSNNVLTDALLGGCYDRRRELFKTASPSMDILISSNFERFLFDISGNDSQATAVMQGDLRERGSFMLSDAMRAAYDGRMLAGYADDSEAFRAIGSVFKRQGYLMDPHTAVGYAVCERMQRQRPLLLVSTASPYKFPEAVLQALGIDIAGKTEMELPALLSSVSGSAVPRNIAELLRLKVRHQRVLSRQEMAAAVHEVAGC